MKFTTPATGSDSDLLAIATGALTFVPAVGSEPATLALKVGLGDPNEEAALRASGKPAWVPELTYLLYRGVDPARVQAAIAQILASPTRLAAANKNYQRPGRNTATAAVLAQVFVQQPDQLGDGIPVLVGEVIGAGELGGAQRTVELQIGDPAVRIVRNPAWYFAFWEMTGLLNLTGNTLAPTILRTDQAFEANGVMRFVAKTGTDANVPFTDSNAPALTVHAALAAARDGDTLVILDTGTYAEAEIVVDKAVNITSVSALQAGQLHLGGELNEANPPNAPALPVLQGNGAFTGIREDMTTDRSFVPVATTHRVLRYQIPAGRGIASLTKVELRYGGAREGGGIYLRESAAVVIACCFIHRNVAFFAGEKGWSLEGYGGGICAFTSDPLIWGNRIERNIARYGGAIGLFARCFPLVVKNYIAKNSAEMDGGGVQILSINLRGQTAARLDEVSRMSKAEQALEVASMVTQGAFELENLYDTNEVSTCLRSRIIFLGNRIIGNRCNDDGGGLYATGLSRILSKKNYYYNNLAVRGDGGGIRISTASELRSIDDIVATNILNGIPTRDSQGRINFPGGGGIASRCSSLFLLRARIEGNRCNSAGGGMRFTSTREGTQASPFPGVTLPSWDDQRRSVFGFNHAHLQIDGSTRILMNESSNVSGRGVPVSAKGGGVHIFRFKDQSFVGDKISVQIEDPSVVIDQSNIAFDAAHTRLYLRDQSVSPELILGNSALGVNILVHVST